MLRIHFGDLDEANYGPSWFKYNYQPEWLRDPFVQEMMMDIDNSKYIDGVVIERILSLMLQAVEIIAQGGCLR